MGAGDNFGAGQFTLNGSAQQLTGIGANAGTVVFKNPTGNAVVYFGSDNTLSSSNGFPLDAGESISIEVLTPNKIWVRGANTEKLAWARVAA